MKSTAYVVSDRSNWVISRRHEGEEGRISAVASWALARTTRAGARSVASRVASLSRVSGLAGCPVRQMVRLAQYIKTLPPRRGCVFELCLRSARRRRLERRDSRFNHLRPHEAAPSVPARQDRAAPSHSGFRVLWDYGNEENELQRTRAVGCAVSAQGCLTRSFAFRK